jgi:hypothetical protein
MESSYFKQARRSASAETRAEIEIAHQKLFQMSVIVFETVWNRR